MDFFQCRWEIRKTISHDNLGAHVPGIETKVPPVSVEPELQESLKHFVDIDTDGKFRFEALDNHEGKLIHLDVACITRHASHRPNPLHQMDRSTPLGDVLLDLSKLLFDLVSGLCGLKTLGGDPPHNARTIRPHVSAA
jgi:hypothetical protein